MSATNAANVESLSLITALADFVVPIVEMHKGHGNIDLSQLADSTYGKNVVVALGEFLASKLKPEIRASTAETETQPFNVLTLTDTIDHGEKDEKKDGGDCSYFDQLPYNISRGTENSFDDGRYPSPVQSTSRNRMNSEYPRRTPSLLAQAMNKTRHFIFNKMPIRLLTFDTNGSNIRLIERSEIWQNVSKRMIQDYDGLTMKSEISKRFSRLWGDVKRRTFKARKLWELEEEKGVAIDSRDTAIQDFCKAYEQYAILSHTWIQDAPGEVIYSDWVKGRFAADSPGHKKLANFCRIAATQHKVSFAWMDTICINKENSAELDESIRSMYHWYHSATVCIIYLAGTLVVDQMHADPWFTRGWTLQEMLSPKHKCFYLMNWEQVLFDVETWIENPVAEQICRATSITQREMNTEPQFISISRRMQWAATRNVTREEDAAYSLMGIFGVSMSTAYGEGGEHAFLRLVKEILATNSEYLLDIVNWGHGPSIGNNASGLCTSQLIPSRPQQYLYSASTPFRWGSTRVPVTLTQKGLHLSAVLMPAQEIGKEFHKTTMFPPFPPRGKFFARTEVHFIMKSCPTCFDILPESLFDASGLDERFTTIFAVMNHSETADEVIFDGDICFAVPLWWHYQIFKLPYDGDKVSLDQTAFPITFRIQQLPPADSEIHIKKTELEKHGMFLRTLYM